MGKRKGYVPSAKLVERVKTREGFIEIKILGRDRNIVLTKYEKGSGDRRKQEED